MSSSSGKGGSSANSSLNYYGTLAGAVGWGPWDWLNGVVLNGNYIFQSNLTLTTDVTDLTGSILDPSLIAPGGYLKFFRGTETQTADAALAGRPPMRGTAYLLAKHIFFGQNSGTAPNLQVIGGGLPRVPTAIVAAIDNVADDGQVNPVACWAEILLDDRGAGMAVAELDAASWLASAHWCAQDAAHRAYTFISPLVTQQTPLRELAKRMLDPFNGFCRWNRDGKLACVIYEWGVDPGGLPLLDARQWTQKPKLSCGDWDSVPTEMLITFTDRDYEYQNNSIIVPNAMAAQVRQVEDQERLDRPFVTRANQAHKHGVEYLRRIGTSPSKEVIRVRAPFVSTLLAGDKIKVDTDPEPGGGGLAQIARIERIEQDKTDVATLTLVTDNLLPATPYTPVWTPASPVAEVSPPMVNILAVPLPPLGFDGLPTAVGILAARPSASVVGMEVHFGDNPALAFDEMGTQIGFAARATLTAGISNSTTTIQLTETDGLSAPDAGLAANTPGGNAMAAANNTLLALIVTLDVNGRIALNGSGDPVMEFVSIVDRAPVSGANYSYTVLRGRMDTAAAAWSTGALVWIFPRVNLTPWRHELFESLAGSVGYFRLVSYTTGAVDDTIPVPECSVNFMPVTAPMYVRALAAINLYFSFIFQRAASAPATPTGDNPVGWTDGPPAGSNPLYMSRGVKRLDTGVLQGTWSTPVRLDGENGADALNSASVFIYQRAASTPTLPSATATFTFATGAVTGLNNGWTQTIPGGTDPLYVSTATAASTGASDTITSGEWAAAQILAQNGTSGGGGGNSAPVLIYQRAASAPSLPSATATYTFATGGLTGLNNGWTQGVPAGSNPLYVSTAVAFGTGSTDTIASGEWATAVIMAENGAPGGSGLNVSPAFIYQRSASGAPTLPSATATFTFATGALSGLNNGWSQTIPGGTDPLYISHASASATGATDTITSGEWATAQLFAQSGTNGGAGGNSSPVFIYQRAASAPTLPSATTTYTFATGGLTGLNNGWQQGVPSGANPLYVAVATAFGTGSTDTIAAGEWSTPVILAEHGSDGDSVEVEYSIDGSTSWHSTFTTGDMYMRQRLGSGAWSAAIKIVGEDGDDGVNGATILGSVSNGGSGSGAAYASLSPPLTLTITSDGNARRIEITSGVIANASGGTATMYAAIFRGATMVAEFADGDGVSLPAGVSAALSFAGIETPGAGSHTYELKMGSSTSNGFAGGGTLSAM